MDVQGVVGQTAVSRTGTAHRPFVGRQRELAELEAVLEGKSRTQPPLLLVTGEPGIGKSRLMDEFGQRAADRGWQLLQGRCWDGSGAPAYWPWMQIVRAAGGDFERLTGPSGTSAASAGRADPESARFRLFEAVAGFLAVAARRQRLIVALDDLHAADESSLLLLQFLASTGITPRPLLLGSYRETDERVRHRAQTFADLVRLAHRVPLRGLTQGQVADYIASVANEAPLETVAAKIHEVTGGNPFFVTELVSLLAAGGEPVRSPDAVRDLLHQLPEEVRALVRRRVAGLSPEAIGSLRVAAVVGSAFDFAVVAKASRLSTERLLGVLDEAVAAGVLTEDRGVPGRYAFAHDLVREALYEDLRPARRLALHRTVGEVIVALTADNPEPRLAELAHHFTTAAVLGDTKEAIEYSVRAGDRAAGLLAYEDAAGHYTRALKLLSLGGQAPESHRGEVLLRLSDAQWRAGDPEAATRSAEEAAQVAAAGADAQMLARAALACATVAMPARQLGGVLLGGKPAARSTPMALLERALAALPEADSALRSRLLAGLAVELYNAPEAGRRLAVAEEAVEMARRVGDADALAAALNGRHWASLAPDAIEVRFANASEMLSVATATGDLEMALLARHCRLHCHLELAELTGVETELLTMAAIAEELRQPFYRWHVVCLKVMRAILHGRFAEADRLAAEAADIVELQRNEFATYMFEFAQPLALRWAQGRLGEMREAVARHGQLYSRVPRWRDALLAAEAGDVPGARAEIERHAARDFAGLPRDGLWMLHHCALAEACVLVGDEPRAARLYELLAPFSERMAVSVSTLPLGPVAMRLGMLAGLLGRRADAEEHFDTALERCDALDARPAAAHVLYQHARVRRTDGDTAGAAPLFDRAAEVCAELDMSGLLARVRELAGAARRARTAAASRSTFRREGEYWTVEHDGELARLRDIKGLHYLASLLAAPGRELHVLELVQAAEGNAGNPTGDAGEGGLSSTRLTGTGALLDSQAKRAYRRHLSGLETEIAEAREWGDAERAARLQEEYDTITRELARALGLGGRDREASSPSERARVSVTKAIRTAIKAIRQDCPRLGEHLDAAVRTGRMCSYAPPGAAPPRWQL